MAAARAGPHTRRSNRWRMMPYSHASSRVVVAQLRFPLQRAGAGVLRQTVRLHGGAGQRQPEPPQPRQQRRQSIGRKSSATPFSRSVAGGRAPRGGSIPARATAAACRPCGAAGCDDRPTCRTSTRHDGHANRPQGCRRTAAPGPSCQANTSSSHASSMAAGQGNSLRPRDRAATRSSMHCRTEVAQPVPHPVPEAAADEPRRCVQGMEVAVPVHEDERTDA